MKLFLHILLIIVLTIVTQVGGVLYLLGVITYKLFRLKRIIPKVLVVTIIYMLGVFVIIPSIAKQNNRVPLPVFKAQKTNFVPHNLFTVFAFRNYVQPPLKYAMLDVAQSMNSKYPTLKVRYMDANFPLFKNFRMLPHLKHDNGKKLDVAFVFKNEKNDKYSGRYFSLFGYGFCEKPKEGESNFPLQCEKQGKWQYNIIEKLVPDQKWRNLMFPIEENKKLVKEVVEHKNVKRVYIEPHLKERLNLNSYNNIRFHGCWAVRHDDHMHIEMK